MLRARRAVVPFQDVALLHHRLPVDLHVECIAGGDGLQAFHLCELPARLSDAQGEAQVSRRRWAGRSLPAPRRENEGQVSGVAGVQIASRWVHGGEPGAAVASYQRPHQDARHLVTRGALPRCRTRRLSSSSPAPSGARLSGRPEVDSLPAVAALRQAGVGQPGDGCDPWVVQRFRAVAGGGASWPPRGVPCLPSFRRF